MTTYLPQVLFYFLCVFARMWMLWLIALVWVGTRAHMFDSCGGHRTKLRIVTLELSTFKDLSLAQSSQGWLATESQGSLCLHRPSARIIKNAPPCLNPLHGFQGSNLDLPYPTLPTELFPWPWLILSYYFVSDVTCYFWQAHTCGCS